MIMLITSVDSQAIAESLARDMLQQRLAACVQISASTTSVYYWEGNVDSAEEYRMSIKTTAKKLDDAIGWLCQHHPYEVPELVWWSVHASGAYADWAHESTQPAR